MWVKCSAEKNLAAAAAANDDDDDDIDRNISAFSIASKLKSKTASVKDRIMTFEPSDGVIPPYG